MTRKGPPAAHRPGGLCVSQATPAWSGARPPPANRSLLSPHLTQERQHSDSRMGSTGDCPAPVWTCELEAMWGPGKWLWFWRCSVWVSWHLNCDSWSILGRGPWWGLRGWGTASAAHGLPERTDCGPGAVPLCAQLLACLPAPGPELLTAAFGGAGICQVLSSAALAGPLGLGWGPGVRGDGMRGVWVRQQQPALWQLLLLRPSPADGGQELPSPTDRQGTGHSLSSLSPARHPTKPAGSPLALSGSCLLW